MQIDEVSEIIHPVSQEFLALCNPKLIRTWIWVYPKDWLKTELVNASLWIVANPKKAPRSDYGRFFTTWLRRSYRPPDPASAAPKPIDLANWEHGYGRKT